MKKDVCVPLTTAADFQEWVNKSDKILAGACCVCVCVCGEAAVGGPPGRRPLLNHSLRRRGEPHPSATLAPCCVCVCAVFDLHKSWCGPCDAVTPTYDRAALEYEDWENRVRFFSVRCSACTHLPPPPPSKAPRKAGVHSCAGRISHAASTSHVEN